MFIDKERARNHKWRIRERTLFLTAAVGGSIGVYCGMFLARHKTKHLSFLFGIPFIILIQIVILYFNHYYNVIPLNFDL
ncbi:hypothetical protein bsdtb5_12250 [Anaeromicropila herbilytica]|uniref:DUF1294 domain-containing protein n=2 Tax=Anaeromicropila herbilytica TaxID=2785025 RepID=A0A7R7EJP5_9FIRM|nr:hypothetical protein bsdtb5_12250 [Anaeromicropila herbilytica]